MCKLYKEEFVYIKQSVKMYSIYLMHCTAYTKKRGNVIMLNMTCDLHLICVKCELPLGQ